MPRRRAINRLELGPIVGHTDEQSTRIWIRARDDPGLVPYALRIHGVGSFAFASTEASFEFGTAVARATGLQSDRQYRYQVLRNGRVVPGSGGSFRTMPDPTSLAEVMFVAISCSHQEDDGAWAELAEFIEEAQPRFLLMMGDQVYLDQSGDLWDEHVRSRRSERRRGPRRAAMAEKYQQSWSRQVVRDIFANIPTYMIWDDHEIRDGWGSWASDSPTLRDRYPRGKDIYDHYNDYFEDTRDVYWHFQVVHNPRPATDILRRPEPPMANLPVIPPAAGARQALPFVFRCGRLAVIMADSRGARDLWRDADPVLGTPQWTFLDTVIDNLPADIDTVAVVTPGPIVTMSADGIAQRLLGGREDDVKFFKEGDADAMRDIQDGELNAEGTGARIAVGGAVGGLAGAAAVGGYEALRRFKVGDIDDVRDQWSNHFSRKEQARLIRGAVRARTANRIESLPRAVIFLGGDIHAGGMFDIAVSSPSCTIPCLISSGISQDTGELLLIGTLVDEHFEVADGTRADLTNTVNEYNFGVVQVIPTGATPLVIPAVAHSGNSFALGVHLGLDTRHLASSGM